MKLRPLVFEGTSFTSVSVTDGLVQAKGEGRGWSTTRPLALWRDFSEMDLRSPGEVEAFVNRYGDPRAALPRPSAIELWLEVQEPLQAAAQAWEPLDANGISHLTTDSNRLHHAWTLGLGPGTSFEGISMRPHRKTGKVQPHANNLGIFMIASAVHFLEAQIPMRRCETCSRWLDASHARTRYCSNACSIKASQQRKIA
ncbi:hypothetical protein I6F07_32005 [Ensifer sp. IC4062]|nr:PLATZ transcription factor family protein [Ensifer sp. IC4062]MCA1444712.1 hypothetical protein [Ensifer sp. IC4062]